MRGDWIAVQFDAVARKVFEDNDERRSRSEEGLGFIRVVSTPAALQRLMKEEDPLSVGDWFELDVSPDMTKAGPNVWSLQLQGSRFVGLGGIGQPPRGKLITLRRLSRGFEDFAPKPLGAMVSPQVQTTERLRKRCTLVGLAPEISPPLANLILQSFGRAWRLSTAFALDVGQASFNLIQPRDPMGPNLYFDVGQPIWFHLHTVPANFNPPLDKNGIVILSHWDTDHYAFGRQHASFHDNVWMAPLQTEVGPNAEAFARQLGNNLLLVGSGKSSRHRRGARIIKCSAKSMNGSGLALHLRTMGRDILLTGDADYHEIPGIHRLRLNGLQIPHHGGRLSAAAVPMAVGNAPRAVASCGLPNRYGHPHANTIALHEAANWDVTTTAAMPGIPRGTKLY